MLADNDAELLLSKGKDNANVSQTLLRGLDLIDAASHQLVTLNDLSAQLDLSRSTAHRLLSALVDRGYLAFTARTGYKLGSKLLMLGALAQEQASVVDVARPYIRDLALRTHDVVQLGIVQDDSVICIDRVAGRRRIEVAGRIGERQPLVTSTLGKALLLHRGPLWWRELLLRSRPGAISYTELNRWITQMAAHARAGHTCDFDENGDRVRCVAAPIYDVFGCVAAAVSISSAAQYVSDDRFDTLAREVQTVAAAISRALGHACNSSVKSVVQSSGKQDDTGSEAAPHVGRSRLGLCSKGHA
jgi:DNA-binding IclR family transcriptional regulator